MFLLIPYWYYFTIAGISLTFLIRLKNRSLSLRTHFWGNGVRSVNQYNSKAYHVKEKGNNASLLIYS